MTSAIELPSGYEPFPEVVFCTNRLRNVSVPLMLKGSPILLIGKGEIPRLWLAGPIEPSGNVWNYIVRDGTPLNPAVVIETDSGTKTILIKVGGKDILRVQRSSENLAIVDVLDLRPLGLKVHGTSAGLNVGGMSLLNNSFQNVRVAFAIGSG